MTNITCITYIKADKSITEATMWLQKITIHIVMCWSKDVLNISGKPGNSTSIYAYRLIWERSKVSAQDFTGKYRISQVMVSYAKSEKWLSN